MTSAGTVDEYIQKHQRWAKELSALRQMILSTPLEETVKWGGPVYTLDGKNLVGLGAFKSYVALWFFQGALLKDPQGKLVNAQEERTKALRQWRFTSYEEIEKDAQTIRAYLKEANANQRHGKEIKPDRQKPLIIPEELRSLLDRDERLKRMFGTLSKSKQREYAEYIAEPKRAETIQKRLTKIEPMILGGVGLNDRYRK